MCYVLYACDPLHRCGPLRTAVTGHLQQLCIFLFGTTYNLRYNSKVAWKRKCTPFLFLLLSLSDPPLSSNSLESLSTSTQTEQRECLPALPGVRFQKSSVGQVNLNPH